LKHVAAPLALLALELGSVAAGGDGAHAVRPHAVTAREIGTRLRVFAKPGDWALSNPAATAVVRKSDGFLSDFWRNSAILPSSEQLGLTADIDGIWQVVPMVRWGDDNFYVRASRVIALPDGVEVDGVAEVHGFRIQAVTTYRLDASEPKLSITTSYRVEGDKSPGPIELGDEVKWGNTTYYVEGLTKPRLKYKGYARWIGRKGAGGDLSLHPTSSERLWVDYQTNSKFPGFWGAISAIYWRKGLEPDRSVTVSRELEYAALPISEAPAPKDAGSLKLSIGDENAKPLAAKIKVEREGSNEPLFPAEGGLDGADHFMWTGNGTLEKTLPAGRYRLFFSAGIERDAVLRKVTVSRGKTENLEVRLPRVIATPGVVGADLHLHQAPSVDADISLPARVVAIAAEGVELAVASDHYVVTDLEPTVRWLRRRGALSRGLITVSGSEVSTLGNRFGHFNVFPLSTSQNVEYVDTTPASLFADARKKSPDGILQVNHPRMAAALGYFTAYGLDPKSAEPRVSGYDPNYDSIEVYNGGDAFDLKRVKKVLNDFMHLVGRGRHYVATGSSDSHNLAFLDPGLPRTLIRYASGGTDAEDARASARVVLDALKAGHATVTSGPIIQAEIAGKGPGETARGVGRVAHLHVVVEAAPWIDVRALEILQGGEVKQAKWLAIRKSKNVVRFDRVIDLPVDAPTFFVITAQGEKGLPNASRGGTLPFAFTNPIWVEP
jgi:hypothetical protein